MGGWSGNVGNFIHQESGDNSKVVCVGGWGGGGGGVGMWETSFIRRAEIRSKGVNVASDHAYDDKHCPIYS